MISNAIKRAFIKAQTRGWKKLYLAIDIHDTIVKANYLKDELPTEFFPGAAATLKLIQERGDVELLLYSCSHDYELEKYLAFFKSKGINFKYANCNPDIQTKEHGLGNYNSKWYFDILFEDKAGFDAETDWIHVADTFKRLHILS